jgi:hypothetical protein
MPEVDPNEDPFARDPTRPVPASEIETAPAPVFIQDGLDDATSNIGPINSSPAPAENPTPGPNGPARDLETGELNLGFALDQFEEPYYVGPNYVDPATRLSADQSRIAAQVKEAQRQQTIINQQRQLNNQDWRLRLSLADNSNYLYNAANPGILSYLSPTNGVIFPYTPQISTSYRANYNNYDLTHSNYRGYFYQNSYTDALTITATFTAQNTYEANYLLAVIHFFRSVTKMFYGQSQNVGSPPPICYLNGLGEYQFNKHAVLVSQFNYTLPSDVDYIRAGSSNNLQLNQNPLRPKTNTANPRLASVQRLASSVSSLYGTLFSTPPGGIPIVTPPKGPNTDNPTYVPTKIDIVLTLFPIQSRTQVSTQFSLENFANGNLLRGGFW